jgi:hypothetical protein
MFILYGLFLWLQSSGPELDLSYPCNDTVISVSVTGEACICPADMLWAQAKGCTELAALPICVPVTDAVDSTDAELSSTGDSGQVPSDTVLRPCNDPCTEELNTGLLLGLDAITACWDGYWYDQRSCGTTFNEWVLCGHPVWGVDCELD